MIVVFSFLLSFKLIFYSFQLSGLALRTIPDTQLHINEYCKAKPSETIMKEHIEELKSELKGRDNLIAQLEADLKSLQQFQRGSVSQV